MSARKNIHVDVAFWAGISNDNLDDLLELANSGVVGFKCSLSNSDVPEFPGITLENLAKAMEILEETDVVLAVS